jgi:hypothetical protein
MSDIVAVFLNKVRAYPALQSGPWPRRIDDFEKALQALFISDNDRAIEMFDEIRGVINRKYVSMEKRIAMTRQILRSGSIHLS